MQFKQLAMAAAVAATAFSAQATTDIQWWHSMTAVNNEWVNDLAKQFNERTSKTNRILRDRLGLAAAPYELCRTGIHHHRGHDRQQRRKTGLDGHQAKGKRPQRRPATGDHPDPADGRVGAPHLRHRRAPLARHDEIGPDHEPQIGEQRLQIAGRRAVLRARWRKASTRCQGCA